MKNTCLPHLLGSLYPYPTVADALLLRGHVSSSSTLMQVVVDLPSILEDLRMIGSHASLNGLRNAETYSSIIRTLYPLLYSPQPATLAEVFSALSPESIAWRAIDSRLAGDEPNVLRALTSEQRAAALFHRVYSVGPIKARKYVEDGARTLNELREATTYKAIKLGVDHFEDVERFIPRSESTVFSNLISTTLQALDSSLSSSLLGSFRRDSPWSSDLDLAIWHPSYQSRAAGKEEHEAASRVLTDVVKGLRERGILSTEPLAEGKKKYIGFARLPYTDKKAKKAPNPNRHRRIDIRICPAQSVPYMLFGGTGDNKLQKILRARALSLGLALNEFGMGEKKSGRSVVTMEWKEGSQKVVKDEKEIFEILGLPWLEPEERHARICLSKEGYRGRY